ncbi:MAG: 16S rRNA (uracil(1498)-N(3))-methyltransferase, partial [Gammaproteobacteria bacterium]|nr:16S rRNA (uracil(1498)-N(3))-methyltransferase [Gammaproteobacteria bacterium]
MTSHRFFVSQLLRLDDELALEPAVSRHISSSLRIGVGESITLFNGRGGEYSAQIIEVTKKCVIVAIEDYCDTNRESTLNVHL